MKKDECTRWSDGCRILWRLDLLREAVFVINGLELQRNLEQGKKLEEVILENREVHKARRVHEWCVTCAAGK